METLRAFIALPISQDTQDAISRIQDFLKKTATDVKWVKPKDIHLTLKFLGDIPIHQINEISEKIRDVAALQRPFSIALTQLGAFPRMESPRIVWIDIENGKKEITEMALSLEEKLQEIGIPEEERDFSAHITVGRVRTGQNHSALSKALKEIQITQPISQTIDRIVLFKSTLTPQGPIYETLKESYLEKV